MAKQSRDGAVEAVKARIDLVDLVRRYVELKPVSGRFMGPCPFHQETKPSFSVNPDGFYYCFGCQASGDIFDFYRQMHGLEFREALEALADEAGVELSAQGSDPAADRARARTRQERKECYELHRLAAEHYQRMLGADTGRLAQEYLAKRRISPELANAFGLGYAPDGWRDMLEFLTASGYGPEAGLRSGLLAQSGGGRVYDRFRARLMFPIADLSGRTIAFGGRILVKDEDAPKYMNSTETPTYTKGQHLYGLYQARPTLTKTRRALLTEGYLDVMALHGAGFTGAVGVLGTALTTEQIRRLASMSGHVDLVFDGDEPGRKAAAKAAELILAQGLTCSAALLPEGLDADDVLRDQGPEAMQKIMDNAQDGLDFLLSRVRNTGSAKETMEFAKRFVSSLTSPDFKAFFLPRLAEGLGLSQAELARSVGGAVGRSSSAKQKPAKPAGMVAEPGAKRDRELLAFAIRNPEVRGDLESHGLEGVLASERSRGLWRKMLAYGDDTIFTYLDDGERGFWAESKSVEPPPGETDGQYLADICRLLGDERCKHQHVNLIMAMKAAKERGDTDEYNRLFKQYSSQARGQYAGADMTNGTSGAGDSPASA